MRKERAVFTNSLPLSNPQLPSSEQDNTCLIQSEGPLVSSHCCPLRDPFCFSEPHAKLPQSMPCMAVNPEIFYSFCPRGRGRETEGWNPGQICPQGRAQDLQMQN